MRQLRLNGKSGRTGMKRFIYVLFFLVLSVACVDREQLLTERIERMIPVIHEFEIKEGRLPFILAEAGLNGGEGADEIHYNYYNGYYTLSFLLDFDMMKTYYSNKNTWGYGYAPDAFFQKEDSCMVSQEITSALYPIFIDDFRSYLLQHQILCDGDTLFLVGLDTINHREEKLFVKNDYPHNVGEMFYVTQFVEAKKDRLFLLVTAFRKENDDLVEKGWYVVEYECTKEKPQLKGITNYKNHRGTIHAEKRNSRDSK